MNTGTEIRALQPTDGTTYREVWSRAITQQAEFFRIALADDPAPSIPTAYTNDSFTLGAFVNTRLVGFVSLQRDRLVKLQHKALVFRMFVEPDRAQAGLGRALLTQLIDRAGNTAGLRQLYLTVLASNTRAQRLYRKAGFVEFSREPEAVRIGEHYVDELTMVRFLK